MPWFATTYSADGKPPVGLVGNFGGYIFAKDRRQARYRAKRRGLNERVEWECRRKARPYVLPSTTLRSKKYSNEERTHSLCWLAHLALKSGAATLEESVGDEGFLHEWAHHIRDKADGDPVQVRVIDIIRMVKSVESKVPGFLEDNALSRAVQGDDK